ncbi:MAG: 5-formyltetrahydrofolate cyclo-ligase [Methanospirillum sp.]
MAVEKRHLRDRARAARACLHPPDLVERSQRIGAHALSLLNGQRTVMAYASKPGEVDTSGLIRVLLDRGIRVVVPIIEPETVSLRLSYLDNPSLLVPSTFGVPEPIGHELPAEPEAVEAVLMPLLGFDRAGNRLGYGAGYYDRFLDAHPVAMKIGVALACQECARVPAEPFDVPLDWVVTEDGPIRCG